VVAPDAAIDLILVEKSEHRLSLVAGTGVVAMYSVALGSGGQGQKHYEGDKTTPMGSYTVTSIIKGTRWHTYLGLDYPNEEDKKRYDALVAKGEAPAGVGAGSGIAIHGRRKDMRDGLHKLVDWTLGCVALDNDEIDEVAARVKIGTRVVIR
jgi:murein L,D-transpeptidase YafK